MKILYITTSGVKIHPYSDEKKKYDFDSTRNTIKNGILSKIKDVEITFAKDIATDDGYIPDEQLGKYDLYLCDITTLNPSVIYSAGIAHGLGKPVIYFESNDQQIFPGINHRPIIRYSEASLENEFQDRLNELIEIVRKDPTNFIMNPNLNFNKKKAFVSYSHNDKEYLDRLLVHLKPLEKNGLIDVWQDTKIKAGDLWKKEIDKALSEAKIAILLISADFMASDFIVDNELPPLLSIAEVKGTKVIPVILSHCRFSRELSLNRFQAINNPSMPLSNMTKDEREAIYDKLALEIESALKQP